MSLFLHSLRRFRPTCKGVRRHACSCKGKRYTAAKNGTYRFAAARQAVITATSVPDCRATGGYGCKTRHGLFQSVEPSDQRLDKAAVMVVPFFHSDAWTLGMA